MTQSGPFCGVDGGCQEFDELGTDAFQTIVFLLGDRAGAIEKLQPIAGLAGLLQRNLQFGDEVGSALSIVCFADVGSDGSTAAAKLGGNDKFLFLPEPPGQFYDLYGEVHRAG